ncbi:phage portal protein [Salipiger abyssi]|uniref:phage portal protein n=1 Tax=Salipiger abyssi TaxID=1250539 RepID=UPI001A8EF1E6|nr:phage portal protein [Salipiger abyssi]MBN9890111.1 phage portal protein [Salipiger abyssi]
MKLARLMKGAIQGARASLAAGESGWVALSGAGVFPQAGYRSTAGKPVSQDSALTVSAVWDCVRKLSQTAATLPLKVYEKSANGGRVEIEPDFADIICRQPNSVQTQVEFWEGMVANLSMRGNAVAEKKVLGRNMVGLSPLPNLTPYVNAEGRIVYEFYDRGKLERLPKDKVFHLRAFDPGNGIGLSTIRYGANSMGAALAADETAGSVFSNAMMVAGVLASDQTLDAQQRVQLGEIINSYVSSRRAGKVMVLEAGLKFEPLQMNPEDAQLLETRRFQVEDVCRWFGVPPIIIGHAGDGQTMWGSGVEQIMLSWLTLGLNPLLSRIEARLQRDIVPPEKRGRWYCEYNREALLQMDSKAKGEFMAKMGQSGTMTANERRQKLNLPRHDDPAADALLAQTALAPLEDLGKEKEQ